MRHELLTPRHAARAVGVGEPSHHSGCRAAGRTPRMPVRRVICRVSVYHSCSVSKYQCLRWVRTVASDCFCREAALNNYRVGALVDGVDIAPSTLRRTSSRAKSVAKSRREGRRPQHVAIIDNLSSKSAVGVPIDLRLECRRTSGPTARTPRRYAPSVLATVHCGRRLSPRLCTGVGSRILISSTARV